MATAEPANPHKDARDASKLGHNNPDEAAHFLKDISDLMDVFMESISSFNRYAQEDAYLRYVFKLHKQMMELDHKYFKYASIDTVLDTIPDKWCKLSVEKPVDDTEDTIEHRQSQNSLPTGYDILTRLVHEANHKALDDARQKVVVELFSQLSDVHNNLSKVAKSISKLGQITNPEQFSFVLKLVVRPLIQLKIPPHLCSPRDLHFAKERLTKEECFEEMCVNEILTKPFHNKLSTIPLKHTTCCLATTTHYLLRKRMFDPKMSQAALTKEFVVAEKKLHLAVSGRKYDPGKKFPKQKPCDKPNPKKKKAAKTDEPKTDEVIKIPEDKQPSPENLGEPQSNDANHDDDDNSLPDPFTPLGTKEDQDEGDTQTMDTDMPELISSNEGGTPQQKFTTKKPSQKKPPCK